MTLTYTLLDMSTHTYMQIHTEAQVLIISTSSLPFNLMQWVRASHLWTVITLCWLILALIGFNVDGINLSFKKKEKNVNPLHHSSHHLSFFSLQNPNILFSFILTAAFPPGILLTPTEIPSYCLFNLHPYDCKCLIDSWLWVLGMCILSLCVLTRVEDAPWPMIVITVS